MNPEHSGKLKIKIPKKMSFWARLGSTRSNRAQGLVENEGDNGLPGWRRPQWSRLLALEGSMRMAEGEQLKRKARVVVSWCQACGDKSRGTQR